MGSEMCIRDRGSDVSIDCTCENGSSRVNITHAKMAKAYTSAAGVGCWSEKSSGALYRRVPRPPITDSEPLLVEIERPKSVTHGVPSAASSTFSEALQGQGYS